MVCLVHMHLIMICAAVVMIVNLIQYVLVYCIRQNEPIQYRMYNILNKIYMQVRVAVCSYFTVHKYI